MSARWGGGGEAFSKVTSRMPPPIPSPNSLQIPPGQPPGVQVWKHQTNRLSLGAGSSYGVYGPPSLEVTLLAPESLVWREGKFSNSWGWPKNTELSISIRAKAKSRANVSLPQAGQAWGRSGEISGISQPKAMGVRKGTQSCRRQASTCLGVSPPELPSASGSGPPDCPTGHRSFGTGH